MKNVGIPRIRIAGCPVDVIGRNQSLELIERFIKEGVPSRHAFVNAWKVVRMQSDPELLEAIETCDLINADGMAIVWASRMLGVPLPERVNGTNMMLDLIGLAQTKGYRVYLLGARPEVVDHAVAILRSQFGGICIAGWHHGYFGYKEEADIAQQIRDAKPDILFVGMGTPKKERWLQRNVSGIEVPFSLGVGGSFDVIAGRVKRAPELWQSAGLEWLWRFIQEPRRMWRRYLLGNPRFLLLVAHEMIKQLRGR